MRAFLAEHYGEEVTPDTDGGYLVSRGFVRDMRRGPRRRRGRMQWFTRLFKIGRAWREVADVADELGEVQGVFIGLSSIVPQLRAVLSSGKPPTASQIEAVVGRLEDLSANGERIADEATGPRPGESSPPVFSS